MTAQRRSEPLCVDDLDQTRMLKIDRIGLLVSELGQTPSTKVPLSKWGDPGSGDENLKRNQIGGD